jgi:protocatechuate 3,4-dioxygenase beta subunit
VPHHQPPPEHDLGLAYDLRTLSRRRALTLFAGVGLAALVAAAYSGRWPHIHFEVYPSLAEATSAGTMIVTSQLAFPEDVCDLVYATEGYEQSVPNMAQTSLESDMVFRDGVDQQLATMTGDVGSGFTAALALVV